MDLYGVYTDSLGNRAAIRNLTVQDNTCFKWNQGVNSQVYCYGYNLPNDHCFVNLTVTSNDLQEPLTGTNPLLHHDSTIASEIHSSLNRFYRTGNSLWFEVDSNLYDLPGWKAIVTSDTTSTATQVSYAHPDRTMGNYAATLGLAPTTDALITACRGQSKALWSVGLTAEYMLTYFHENFQ